MLSKILCLALIGFPIISMAQTEQTQNTATVAAAKKWVCVVKDGPGNSYRGTGYTRDEAESNAYTACRAHNNAFTYCSSEGSCRQR